MTPLLLGFTLLTTPQAEKAPPTGLTVWLRPEDLEAEAQFGADEHTLWIFTTTTATKWDLRRGSPVTKLETPFGFYGNPRFSPRYDSLEVRVLETNFAALWNLSNGEITALPPVSSWRNLAVFSPDGSTLAMGEGNVAKLYELQTGKLVQTFTGHQREVTHLAFSTDGKYLITSSFDGTGRLWEIATGAEQRVFGQVNAEYSSFGAIISIDGKSVFGQSSRAITAWDIETGARKFRTTCEALSLQLSPDGDRIATTHDDLSIRLWDSETGAEIAHLVVPRPPDQAHNYDDSLRFEFSRDGQRIVAASRFGTIHVWETETGKVLATSQTDQRYQGAGFSPSGDLIVAETNLGTIELWDAKNLNHLCSLVSDADKWIVATPDGRFDSSHGGNAQITWQIGQDFSFSAVSVREEYYEPGLLAKVLGYNKEPLKPVTPIKEAKILKAPDFWEKEYQGSRRLFEFEDRGGGIGPTELRISGTLARTIPAPKPSEIKDGKYEIWIDLNDPEFLRRNRKSGSDEWRRLDSDLEVFTSAAESSDSKAVSIRNFFTNSTDTPDDPQIVEAPPKAFIIAIAAGTSPDATKATVDLANTLRAVSSEQIGPEAVHLTVLSGDSKYTATKPNIERVIQEIARKATPADLVVVLMSGRGILAGGENPEYHFLPSGLKSGADRPTRAPRDSISAPELSSWLSAIPAWRKVLVLDTIATDEFTSVTRAGTEMRRSLNRLQDQAGLLLFANCADQPRPNTSFDTEGLVMTTLNKLIQTDPSVWQLGEFENNTLRLDTQVLFRSAYDAIAEKAERSTALHLPEWRHPGTIPFFRFGQLPAALRSQILAASPIPILNAPTFVAWPENERYYLFDNGFYPMSELSAANQVHRFAHWPDQRDPGAYSFRLRVQQQSLGAVYQCTIQLSRFEADLTEKLIGEPYMIEVGEKGMVDQAVAHTVLYLIRKHECQLARSGLTSLPTRHPTASRRSYRR